jgi:NADPH:quinone reductase-like Zn-dependent oxidoreductase
VTSVGAKVKRFVVGDEVYGDLSGTWGGFAEFVCAKDSALEKKPPRMMFEEAAAIPQAGMLAVQALVDVGEIRNGMSILINGAGGGVGTLGIQIAKQFNVDVTGVDSAEKLAMMKSMGFDHVMDYQKTDFTKTGEAYDLIVDTKTNRPVSKYMRALKPGGKYVTVGGEIPLLLQMFLFGRVVSFLNGKQAKIVALKPNKDLLYMNQLFEDGKLKPVLDQTFRLEEAAEAMKYYASGKQKGKVVITNYAA